MKESEQTNLQKLFKEEVKKSISTHEIFPFPSSLEVQPSITPNLDQWRKEK